MKKFVLFAAAVITASAAASCSSTIKCPDEPVIFTAKENGEYLSIVWENKEYVPFCSGSRTQMDQCLGYYLDGEDKIYICSLKMQSSDEWIIDYKGEECSELVIYREKNTCNIPYGLYSDYKWNKN